MKKKKFNLRERLIKFGPHTLSDEELLAVIIRTGYKNKNVLQLAKEIISSIHTKNIVDITYRDLKYIKGLGKTKIATLLACIELVKRYLITKPKIITPDDAVKCCYELLSRKKEYIVVLYLNMRKMLLGKEYLSIGSSENAYIEPKEVFIPALKYNASSIIILHNHPSGETDPSKNDIELTKNLVEAGNILNIEVLDHIIVSETEYFSFKEHKLI